MYGTRQTDKQIIDCDKLIHDLLHNISSSNEAYKQAIEDIRHDMQHNKHTNIFRDNYLSITIDDIINV